MTDFRAALLTICAYFTVAVLCLFGAMALPQPSPAPCLFAPRATITMRSPLDDPYVLLWNSRSLLVDYMGGRWGSYRVLLGTRLLDPNTLGVVESACPLGNRRVLGVLVLSGRHKGAFGYIDIHDARP
jgi:hypothetical protein